MALNFSLENISAISIGGAWDGEPNISRVPPVARRRLGDCARLAFSVTSGERLEIPVIFSSYVGEINRCLSLLANLKDEISPTSFSLSVLNAVPAQLSIDSKNNSEILAVSARASFEIAVISALKFKEAYVISYFESPSKPYFKNEPLCVAIGAKVVCGGDRFSLEYEPCDGADATDVSEIRFLRNYERNSEWYYCDGALKWKWRRKF